MAADPDRDQVYVVDLTKRVVTATFKLSPGDEPGRVVIDGVGRAPWRYNVAARRQLDPRLAPSGQTLLRREVCAAPRGVAYDKGMVSFTWPGDGQLVSLPAAGGAAVRTVTLDGDLRDVVVDGARLKVSRFRTAKPDYRSGRKRLRPHLPACLPGRASSQPSEVHAGHRLQNGSPAGGDGC